MLHVNFEYLLHTSYRGVKSINRTLELLLYQWHMLSRAKLHFSIFDVSIRPRDIKTINADITLKETVVKSIRIRMKAISEPPSWTIVIGTVIIRPGVVVPVRCAELVVEVITKKNTIGVISLICWKRNEYLMHDNSWEILENTNKICIALIFFFKRDI